MPTYIACYDLKETNPDPYPTFMTQAIAHDWEYWIEGSRNASYRLLNTTLRGVFADMAAAVAALENVRSWTEFDMKCTVTMSKWIIVEYSDARFASDERHHVERRP